jgi:HSP20 family molecular chaperone IbpA
LPVEVDANGAKADIENGTLIVTLPKLEPAKPKTIKLKPRLK